MSALRLFSLPTHAVLELLGGLALMAAPFALGLSAAAMVTAVLLGALVAGLALQSLDIGYGRPVAISAHFAADYGIALGLAGAAVVLAGTDTAATLLFGAAAVMQLTLNLVTRYSQR